MMYENGATKYDMKIDRSKKTFFLFAKGFFTQQDGDSYLNDFNRLIKTFNTNEYKLILDACELKPSTPEVTKHLQGVLARYIEVPFKKRYLITSGNMVAVSQIKRLGKSIEGWKESVEYITSIDKAL